MNLITSMRKAAIDMTELGTKEAAVWYEVGHIFIEVFADAADIIYTMVIGEEVSWTQNVEEFVFELEWELS